MSRFYGNLNAQDKKEFILGFATIILLIVPLVFFSISNSLATPTSTSGMISEDTNSNSRYKYYCNECGDGISGQPYQCILYMCTQTKEGQVASGLDTFCSCSCGVEHRRKEGFKYECY